MSVLMGAVVALPVTLTLGTPVSAVEVGCFPTTDRWQATVLDIPGASAWDINNRGDIVGGSSPTYISDVPYVFRDGQVTYLDAPGDPNSARGIDENGDIAGYSRYAVDNRTHAVLWHGGPGLVDLGTLGGTASFGYAIDNGFVAGTVFAKVSYPANPRRAFVWKDGQLTMLPVTNASKAVDVNENGMVVGVQGLGDGFPSPSQRTEHAFVYANGTVTDLGTLGTGKWSVAKAVNDRGQVLGWSATAPHGVGHDAFVWNAVTGKAIVEDGPGAANPQDINNNGMLVGTYSCSTAYGVYEPAVWLSAGSAPLRLPVPGDVEGLDATAVNDNGTIVGIVRNRADQRSRAIVWQPVP